MPILECLSYQPLLLMFCELRWPRYHCSESCPHKCGQDVSYGHLIRRWQFLLKLLLHHTPMVDSLHLCFPLGHSERLPLVACRFFLLWSRFGQNCPRQRSLTIWTFFVHPRTFFPPRHEPWAWYEMDRDCQIPWPHNNILKHFKMK